MLCFFGWSHPRNATSVLAKLPLRARTLASHAAPLVAGESSPASIAKLPQELSEMISARQMTEAALLGPAMERNAFGGGPVDGSDTRLAPSFLVDATNQPAKEREAAAALAFEMSVPRTIFGLTHLFREKVELPVWCGTISVDLGAPAVDLSALGEARARRGATTCRARVVVTVAAYPPCGGGGGGADLSPPWSSSSAGFRPPQHGRFVCETLESAFARYPAATATRWGTIHPARESDREALAALRRSLEASDRAAVPPVYRSFHSYYQVQGLLNVTILARDQAMRRFKQQDLRGLPHGDDDELVCCWAEARAEVVVAAAAAAPT